MAMKVKKKKATEGEIMSRNIIFREEKRDDGVLEIKLI